MEISQLLKGVLDLAVLAVLSDEDGYGYDVAPSYGSVSRIAAAANGTQND